MKKTTVTYRLYKPSDKQEFIRCVEAMQDYFVEQDSQGWLRRTKNFGPRFVDEHLFAALKNLKGEIHVAMDGKRMVGMTMGSVETVKGFDLIHYVPGRYGWVYVLYVDPKYRDYKIGSTLLDRLERFFAKEKCDVIRLEAQGNVERLEEFYGRRGYKPWLSSMIKRTRPRRKQ